MKKSGRLQGCLQYFVAWHLRTCLLAYEVHLMMTSSNGKKIPRNCMALCAGKSLVPVTSPHKGQWRGALMFSFICVWINGWVNNREAGDLRRHRGHYDVNVVSQNPIEDTKNSSASTLSVWNKYPVSYSNIICNQFHNHLCGNFLYQADFNGTSKLLLDLTYFF